MRRLVLYLVAITGVICSSLLFALDSRNPARTDQMIAVDSLQSSDIEVRKAAKAEILHRCETALKGLSDDQAIDDLPGYDELVDGLIEIVRKERKDYEKYDEKLLAVELLGELRAASAVDVLLDNITFHPPQELMEITLEAVFPCVLALVRIGEPSTRGILERLDREYDDDLAVTLCAVVILRVEGKENATMLLKKRLGEAVSDEEESNIGRMLGFLGD